MADMEITFEFHGIDEFLLAVESFDYNMQREVHLALLNWAGKVEELAKKLVPVRTGFLRSSIYAMIQGWIATVGASAPYASFVEFGTRYMQARPYLYPAIQQYLPELEQIILDAIHTAKMEAGFR